MAVGGSSASEKTEKTCVIDSLESNEHFHLSLNLLKLEDR